MGTPFNQPSTERWRYVTNMVGISWKSGCHEVKICVWHPGFSTWFFRNLHFQGPKRARTAYHFEGETNKRSQQQWPSTAGIPSPAWCSEPISRQALLSRTQDLGKGFKGCGIAGLELPSGHGGMICQGLEALHGVWCAQRLASWLVEEAIHISSQAVEGALAAVHLDGSVKCRARLHWHIAVTKEDEVSHEPGSAELGGGGFLGDQLGVVGLTLGLRRTLPLLRMLPIWCKTNLKPEASHFNHPYKYTLLF